MVDLWDSGIGLLSTQVLQEFFVSVTKKIQKPLDTLRAKEVVSDLMKWDIFVNDGETILGAIDIHQRYQYSFWDSMILCAAIDGGASTLLSEDFTDGQTVLGTRIENPLRNSSSSQ
ncbi:MAG: PIN domain-containing protein [bacterium]